MPIFEYECQCCYEIQEIIVIDKDEEVHPVRGLPADFHRRGRDVIAGLKDEG